MFLNLCQITTQCFNTRNGHGVEGTEAHEKLTDFLGDDKSLRTRAENKFFDAEDDYGVTKDEINKILKKKEHKEELTLEEQADYDTFTSEVGANLIAGELGTEDFIDKIIRLDENAARKIIGKIKDMKAAIKSLESKESREKYRRLRRAEKLFLKAAEQAGNNELVRFIQSDDEEEEKAYLNAFENEEIISLVEKVANGNFDPKEKVYLGEISNELVDTIKELTDIDTTGFKIAVEARQINHILKDHGKNGKSDKSMSDYSDIAKIEYALNEYDDISRGKSTNAYKNVINGKTQGAQTILYEKNIGDRSYYVVQAVPDTKSKTLFVVSAFIGEKGYKKEAPQFANDNNLGATSEIGTANTSNDIISQKSKKSTPEVKKSKKIQYSYAGDKSKTANHSLLVQAKKLESQGAKSEEIRQKTGWFKGYDGKWRYEIDDSKMEFLGVEVDKETTLGEVIKHDELFKAYPELREVRFIVDSSLNDKGYYDYKNNLIKIPANLVSDASLDIKLKKLLIHEIQHAIQGIEGFTKGGSWSAYERELYKEKKLKIAAASTASKIYLRKIEKRFGKYGVQVTNDYYDLIKHPDTEEDYFNDLKELEQELKEDGMFELVSKYVDAKLTMIGEAQGVSLEAWDKYEKTAGEIEAYDVADRLNFTPEQRKTKRPDIDQKKVEFVDEPHSNTVSEGDINNLTRINDENMQVSEEDINKQNKDTATEIQKYQQYSEVLKKQFDEWLQGKMPYNDSFELGETPPVMIKWGAPKLPLILPEDKILKFTTDYGHEISLDDAATLPVELFEPVFLFKGSVEGSFVAVTDIYDKSGDQVIVAIHPNKWQKRIRVNRVASLYGKYNIENYVENNINNGNLLDASIKKAPNWFTNRGLQLPKLVQTILGTTNSISQNSEKSTPELKKSKKIQYSYSSDKNRTSKRSEAEEKEICYANLLKTADNLLNAEKGRFFSASIYNGNTLKQIPGILRKELRNAREVTGGIRKSLVTVKEWYNSPDNKMLFRMTDNNMLEIEDGQIVYDEDIAAFLEEICAGEGALNLNELKKLDKIGSYFLKVADKYKRVLIDGKWVDAVTIAEKKISAMASAYANQTFITKGLQNKYMRQFGEPANICRCADGYDEDGFWTWWFNTMREANVNIEVDSMNALRPYREWHETHKKWGNHLENDTVTFRDQKIPIQVAMTLYCSLKTRKSQQGLADSGYEWREGKKKDVKKNKGLIEKTDIINKKSKRNNRKAVEAACKAAEKELWEMFSEEDRQYIEMFEDILNEECRKWKIETDKQMKGFSLVSEDGEYYFPTVHAQIKKTISTSNYEGDRVTHLSSNKNVVEGARGSLLLEPIDVVVFRHIRNQLLYKHYAIVTENVSMLLNINVGNNVHNPKTLKTMIEEGGEHYRELLRMMDKLSKDLQGTPKGEKAEQQFMYEMIKAVRSGYAVSVLSLNPKVLFSQLSSLIAAGHVFDFSTIVRGLKGFVSKKSAEEVVKYCPIAELRKIDNVAAKAQGVLDNTRKLGDFFMKGVGWVDSRVICAEWEMAQIHVEKYNGAKYGTEENKIEAGKLLAEVILETQQSTFATERSDAMRGGEGVRFWTMFSHDGMKSTARELDGIGKVSILKRRIKKCNNETERKKLESELKKAKKELVKSTSVLASQAIYMSLIAWFFRFLYDRDEDEPVDEAKNIGADMFGNMLGGLPILRDIYSFFSDGYEIDNFMLSTVNDVLIASQKSMNLAIGAMKGENITKQDVASSMKNVLVASGQLLGIPIRNAYNISSGLTRRFLPSSGYKFDNLFYTQSYTNELKKAIENGDEEMIDTIVGIVTEENVGLVVDNNVRREMNKLSMAGYSILPKSVGSSITYDGEEITLTKRQQNRFKQLYSAANEGAAQLVRSSLYNRADEAAKAKAIKFLYDTYYNLALQESVGVDLESKNVLFAEAIDIEDLAIIYSIASTIEADKDRKGNAIAGSRKAKIEKYVESLRMSAAEKYLIMGYLGYKCKNGEDKVKAYVGRLNLTNDEKQKLIEYCGYVA